jgi:hypothetical protein
MLAVRRGDVGHPGEARGYRWPAPIIGVPTSAMASMMMRQPVGVDHHSSVVLSQPDLGRCGRQCDGGDVAIVEVDGLVEAAAECRRRYQAGVVALPGRTIR